MEILQSLKMYKILQKISFDLLLLLLITVFKKQVLNKRTWIDRFDEEMMA